MTVCMITFGLVPALWAHGAGAEAIQRIAAPMIGGLITSTILTLEIVPAIYSLWRGRQVQWVKGPRPLRKKWSELSMQFVEMERAGHHDTSVVGPSATEASPVAESKPTEQPKSGFKLWLWVLIAVAVVTGLAVWRSMQLPEVKPVPSKTNTTVETKPLASPEKLDLTATQAQAAKDFVAAAAALGEGLAADNLTEFNRAAAHIAPMLETMERSLPAGHPWRPMLEKISTRGNLVPAGDLGEARTQFLPFSTAVTEFIRVARQQAEPLKLVKLYRCPMAPQPGYWLQLEGPLRNPYFGSEMLDCGSELGE